MPEAVLSIVAGLQVPVMPLEEVAGNAGTVPPLHIVEVVPKPKVGVTTGFTVTAKEAGIAHCPDAGVNVYVAEAVLLMVAGLQVPVIPLEEVAGKAGADPPLQIVIAVPKVKVGVIFVPTVTVNVTVAAH